MGTLPDDARSLVDGRNFAHLATVGPDGSPHSVPVWIGLEGERLAFFTQVGTRKARNIQQEPRVAFSIEDGANPYRSAWIRGRVAEVLEGEAALAVIDRLSEKYVGRPFPMRRGIVFLVEPERAGVIELPFEHR